MASTYSTNLAIELIGTGDQAGTWGTTTNSNLGTLIEQAISGYVTQAVATGTDTTITIPNGATGVARNMYIELTGTGGASTNLIVPANKKLYFIFNNSTGAVTVKVSGQTGVSVAQGAKVILVSNGTDIVNATDYIRGDSANITVLTSSSATITNLLATTAQFGSASISNADILSAVITGATITSSNITTLTGTTVSFGSASLTGLNAASAQLTKFTAGSSAVSNLLASGAITAVGNISTSGNLSASGSITASSGSITQLTSTSATITTLKATSATIDNVSFTSIVLTNATITSANITTLTGTTVGYASASVTNINISASATIGRFSAGSSAVSNLLASGAITAVGNISSSGNISASGSITGSSGVITQFNSTSATITTLTGTSSTITTIAATSASITGLSSTSANITTLTGTTVGYASASITTITGTTIGTTASATIRGISGSITTLTGTSADITTITGLTIGNTTSSNIRGVSGNIGQLTSTSANITTLSGTTATFTSATVTNLALTSLTISNLSIVSANITTLTGTTFGTTATTQLRGASGAITTLTSSSANITNLLATTLTVSGVGIFPAGSAASAAITTTGDTNTGIFFPAADTIAFTEGGVEAARFDSSGNLGIGTSSPSTIGVSGYTRLVLGAGSASTDGLTIVPSGTGGVQFTDAANVKKGYVQWDASTGALALGTTGTTKATLDSSGNLGIGTSSPASKLEVYGAFGTSTTAATITNTTAFSASNIARIDFKLNNSFAGSERCAAIWALNPNAAANNGGALVFGVSANGTATTPSEVARFDQAGNLGISEGNAPTQVLSLYRAGSTNALMSAGNTNTGLNGTWFGVDTAGNGIVNVRGAFPLLFSTSATERARITSGGVLCVNSSSNVGSEITLFKQTAGSGSPVTRIWNNATSGNSEFIEFATETSYTARGSITYDRTAGLVAYNTTSDYRAKDILGPVANPGATIDALKVYEGQMKGATQSRPMLVAHEAQEHAPYAVTGEKDAVNEDGTPKYQQMNVSALVPLLLAEIQLLRARVAQLESK